MRYDTKVLFIKNGEGSHYDPNLGEWIENEPTVTVADANVTDLGTNRSVALFGDIKQGAVVVRTQPLFLVPEWDSIEINGKSYKQTTSRKPLERNSFIVEEVVKGG